MKPSSSLATWKLRSASKMTVSNLDLTIGALRCAYLSNDLKPSRVIGAILARLDDADQAAVWISTPSASEMMDAAKHLEARSDEIESLPLYGIPFSVKDNIDVAGAETTAACPAFAYRAKQSATVVARALAAGAIFVGKTNLDQFATGLVGVRSPYGVPSNPFNPEYIPGGSSSGAGVSVATGMVSFAFGTDTGGSGRVPASYTGIYGYKPAPGAWSRAGLVYACRSFDTPSVFANSLDDARAVDAVVKGWDPMDPFSHKALQSVAGMPRLAMAPPAQIETFGEGDIARLYAQAHGAITHAVPGTVPADIAQFQTINDLMFFGPMLAERDASVGGFIDANPDGCHDVVRNLIASSRQYSAADAYRALYQVQEATAKTRSFWDESDILILPTVGGLITRQMCETDPLGPNFRNGLYTNFANPMGLAALSVPFAKATCGVPWGVTLYAPQDRVDQLFAGAEIVRDAFDRSP